MEHTGTGIKFKKLQCKFSHLSPWPVVQHDRFRKSSSSARVHKSAKVRVAPRPCYGFITFRHGDICHCLEHIHSDNWRDDGGTSFQIVLEGVPCHDGGSL